ncbi:MAG: methionyl-tRNA formyltransferase [Pseudomonadota bacterium]
MRVVFMGTPDFAVPTLDAIAASGHDVLAIYSQPARRAGRGMAERPSPVHARGLALGVPVYTPTSLRSQEAVDMLASLAPDVCVVVAYGLLLPQAILDVPEHGCLNLHPSALPRWRGAAPLQRTLMAGDTASAIIVMRMDAGLDTGPICLRQDLSVDPDITAGAYHDEIAAAGAPLMVAALDQLEAGSLACTPQPETGVTYAAKIDKAEAQIDWARSAKDLHHHIRGLSPFPGAWFACPLGPDRTERIKVLSARCVTIPDGAKAMPGQLLDGAFTVACGDGAAVQLLTVQRAGKKATDGAAALRGLALAPGDIIAPGAA